MYTAVEVVKIITAGQHWRWRW